MNGILESTKKQSKRPRTREYQLAVPLSNQSCRLWVFSPPEFSLFSFVLITLHCKLFLLVGRVYTSHPSFCHGMNPDPQQCSNVCLVERATNNPETQSTYSRYLLPCGVHNNTQLAGMGQALSQPGPILWDRADGCTGAGAVRRTDELQRLNQLTTTPRPPGQRSGELSQHTRACNAFTFY